MEEINEASLTSLNNAGADTGYTNFPLIDDLQSFRIAPSGEQQNLDFLNEPFNFDWPDSKKNRWDEHNLQGVSVSPAGAAGRTLAEVGADRTRAIAENDPMRQAELATKRTDLAAKQREAQAPYQAEQQFQDVLSRLTNNSSLGFLERRQLVAQANALAGTIAQMQPGAIKSAAGIEVGAKSIGTINIMNDLEPQVAAIKRASDARMGLAKQQLEATNTPLPEFVATPPPPTASDIAIKEFGLKADDGSAVEFRGRPVLQTYKDGKQIYERVGTDGRLYELTPQEVTEITGGR